MVSCRLNNFAITLEKVGTNRLTKAGYPIGLGKYCEIKTSGYEFQLNLKGEIKSIRGLHADWPHPSELLKRTDGSDWVFYTVGRDSSDKGIVSLLGEYYLPCLPYSNNSIWEFNPFMDSEILRAFAAWSQLYADLYMMPRDSVPPKIKDFLDRILANNENKLFEQSARLHSIIGERLSVLPPDTRHVDYEIIPLTIADGCLYRCNFCCVKSHQGYQPRSSANILEQIRQLNVFYEINLENYNALFLGNHDALGAGDELICMAAAKAVKTFGFGHSHKIKPMLFLFGSVDSLLKAGSKLFEKLDQLPFYTYINIGLESIDAPTLKSIHKPVESSAVRCAFQKLLEINRVYTNIEITANFLLGEQLSPAHYESLTELLSSVPDPLHNKGVIYLSPLMDSRNKPALLQLFRSVKEMSRLPIYIYLIQRL